MLPDTSPRRRRRALGCDSSDLGLIVSELATNACVHAGSAFTVSLHRQGSDVLVEVGDQNPAPAVAQPPSTGVSGRGLQIVAAIAADWGVATRDPGKAVWAVLPLSVGRIWFRSPRHG